MPSLSSGGANPASPVLVRAGLAVAIMAQTIFPIFNNAFRRTVGNNSNFISNTANNLVLGHFGVALCVLPDAMVWFMGFFTRIMSTPTLPFPTAVPSINTAPQRDILAPVYVYETFEYGYIAATQPPAPPSPSSTMSEWPLTSRELYWSTFRAAPLFSFASDPTPLNEVAVWVAPGAAASRDFLGTVAYPLAAAFVLIAISVLVGKMIDRTQVNVYGCAKRACQFLWRSARTMGRSLGSIGLLLTLHSYAYMSSEDCTEAVLYEIVGHPQVAVLGQAFASWASDRVQRIKVSLVSIRAPPASILARKLPLASAGVVRDRNYLAALVVRFFNHEAVARFYLGQPAPPSAPSANRQSPHLGEKLAEYVAGLLWKLRIYLRDRLALLNTKCHRASTRLIAVLPRLPPYWGHTITFFYLGVFVLIGLVVHTVPRFIWISGFIYWYYPLPWNNLLRWALNWVLDRVKEDPLLGPIIHRLLLVRLDEEPNKRNGATTPPAHVSTSQRPKGEPSAVISQELGGCDEKPRESHRRRKSKKRTHSATVLRVPDPTTFDVRAPASLPHYRPDGRSRYPHLSSAPSSEASLPVPSGLPPASVSRRGDNARVGSSSSAGRGLRSRSPARVQERVIISYPITAGMIISLGMSPHKGEKRGVAPTLSASTPSPVRASPTTTPGVEVRSATPSVPGSPAPSSVSSGNVTPPRVVLRGVTPSSPSGASICALSTPPASPPSSPQEAQAFPCLAPIQGPPPSIGRSPEEGRPAYKHIGVESGSDIWKDLWSLMPHSGCNASTAGAGDVLTPEGEVSQPEQSTDSLSKTRPDPLLDGERVASDFCALPRRNIPSNAFGNREEDRQQVYQGTLIGRNVGESEPVPPSKRVGTTRCTRMRRERSQTPEDIQRQWRVDADPNASIDDTPPSSPPSAPWKPATPSLAPKKGKALEGALVVELNRAVINMSAQFKHLSISSLRVIDWPCELPEVEMAETMEEVEGSQGVSQMELDF